MRRFFYIAMAALLIPTLATAQTTILGGEVISPANMSHMEAAKYSQAEYGFMSARVAGMGGAYTSLGADLSSMAINPAGLGMYRSSAMSFTMGYDHTSSKNSTVPFSKGKGDLSFGQIGTALNLYQGTGSLVSFTLGFAYNKLADLNFRNSAGWDGGEVTIAEFFAEQMYGIDPSLLGSNGSPFSNPNIYADEWGGVLAYRTYLMDPAANDDGSFAGNYIVPGIPLSSRINSAMEVVSEGNVGEFDFSMGFNFGNFLYLGTTLGLQDIEQSLRYNYSEQYVSVEGGSDEVSYMEYGPRVGNYGSGVNFKIGAILRPTSGLRIGVAYHSPTIVSLTRDYYTNMTTEFRAGDSYFAESSINSYTYSYSSPSKLLLGASVTIGNKAILSVDYDKVWYSGMSMHTEGLEGAFANDVEADLGSSNNVRVGVEFVPVQNIYVRGGYAYYGSPLGREAAKYYKDGNPFYGNYKTDTQNFSLGAGFRFGFGSSLDIAWTLSKAHYTNSIMYYYSYVDAYDNVTVSGPVLSNLTHTTNNVAVTYTMLF